MLKKLKKLKSNVTFFMLKTYIYKHKKVLLIILAYFFYDNFHMIFEIANGVYKLGFLNSLLANYQPMNQLYTLQDAIYYPALHIGCVPVLIGYFYMQSLKNPVDKALMFSIWLLGCRDFIGNILEVFNVYNDFFDNYTYDRGQFFKIIFEISFIIICVCFRHGTRFYNNNCNIYD